jgi:hypothetical protein
MSPLIAARGSELGTGVRVGSAQHQSRSARSARMPCLLIRSGRSALRPASASRHNRPTKAIHPGSRPRAFRLHRTKGPKVAALIKIRASARPTNRSAQSLVISLLVESELLRHRIWKDEQSSSCADSAGALLPNKFPEYLDNHARLSRDSDRRALFTCQLDLPVEPDAPTNLVGPPGLYLDGPEQIDFAGEGHSSSALQIDLGHDSVTPADDKCFDRTAASPAVVKLANLGCEVLFVSLH